MCINLVKVCKYLGQEVTLDVIVPELVELLDDEENEVKVVGFKTYCKFIKKIFKEEYLISQKNQRVTKKLLGECLQA